MLQSQELLSTYFQLAVDLLHEHSWSYNFKATEILDDDVRGKVPPTFLNFFQSLSDSDTQFQAILNFEDNDCWPPEVSKFVSACKHLQRLTDEAKKDHRLGEYVSDSKEPLRLPRKWNAKKYFEVAHVGNFVGKLCVRERCDMALDIGSGLGYLSSHLASQFRVPVVGIESETSRVETARRNFLADSSSLQTNSVQQTFACLRISENISEELEPHQAGHSRVCLTALHACGDLTPWSLRHFISSDSCKCIAVVPCCYHKMEVTGPNFPMSSVMKAVMSRFEDVGFIKNSWLWRLASQRSGSKFLDDMDKETRNLFYRALLEKYTSQEHIRLIKTKRKLQDSKYSKFSEYLETVIGPGGGFSLVKDEQHLSGDELRGAFSHLNLLHQELANWSSVITGILAMQGALQAIAEDLILFDRLAFLQESNSVANCGLIKVIPDNVSPRGMVLFGVKK